MNKLTPVFQDCNYIHVDCSETGLTKYNDNEYSLHALSTANTIVAWLFLLCFLYAINRSINL